ncbi:MAG: hypothetical protein PSX81_13530 [bacterium]|nr:hypothetical protein [bacterium]
MILNSLYVFFHYAFFVCAYQLGIKKGSKINYSGKSLVDRPQGSHRLIDGNQLGLLVIPIFYYRLLFNIFLLPSKKVSVTQDNGIGLYDEANSETPRLDFIHKMSGQIPGIYINKQELMNYELPTGIKLILGVIYFWICLLLLPFTLSKNRQLYALLIHEIYELSVLFVIVKKHKIKHLYYSCIFEKDSNAATYLLQKKHIYVTKNPSEDPLYFHNQFIIADELGICNPYQWEELEAYSSSIFVKKFNQWLPEQYEPLLTQNLDQGDGSNKNVIGYYSGASWLNKHLKNNLTSDAYNPYKAEEELITYLAEFLKNNTKLTLKIFLHPLEKKVEYIELSRKHYSDKFQGTNYEVADITKSNYEMFNECNIAITIFSGLMIYRFYRGLKGIFYNPYFPNYPLHGSTFAKISSKNREQLFSQINEIHSMNNEDFNIIKLKGMYQWEKVLNEKNVLLN